MGLIGDIFQGWMGSNAAKNAAKTQSDAADQAKALEQQNQNNALEFQAGAYDTTKQNEQPYLNVGSQSANKLASYLQTPFSAPTLADVQNTPGYQFQLGQGIDALDKSAAASGNLFSGSQGTALERFGQGLADTTYGEAYNRALQTYQTNYSDLMGGAQLGENAAGTVGQLGQAAANNVGNIDLTGGAQQAQQINNAAAARASGYVGSANAWNGAINNANSQLQQAAFLMA